MFIAASTFSPVLTFQIRRFALPATAKERASDNGNEDGCDPDPDYRENQMAAQREWQARNPGYWRKYRNARSNRFFPDSSVKMDTSGGLPSGVYRVRKYVPTRPQEPGFWLIEVAPVCSTCPCKMDM